MKRRPMKKHSSQKLFSRTAKKTHPKNMSRMMVTRGGYRI